MSPPGTRRPGQSNYKTLQIIVIGLDLFFRTHFSMAKSSMNIMVIDKHEQCVNIHDPTAAAPRFYPLSVLSNVVLS